MQKFSKTLTEDHFWKANYSFQILKSKLNYLLKFNELL